MNPIKKTFTYGAHQVTLETGEILAAKRIVLATDDASTRRLLGRPAESARPMRGVTAAYFSSRRPLYTGPLLVLPAGAGRLVPADRDR